MPLHKLFFYLFLLYLPTQLGRHFWPQWSFVWGLRIDYLAPTVYLSDILLGLTLGTWAIRRNESNVSNWYYGKKKIKKQLFSTFFYLYSRSEFKLCLFLLFSTFFFLNFRAAVFSQLWLYKLVKLGELVLLGIYVAKTTKSKTDLVRIVNLLLIGAVFESGLAIAQFFKQSSLGGIFWWLGERTFNITTPGIAKIALDGRLFLRPYATFSHPNSLAGYLLVVLTLLLGFKPKTKNHFSVFKYLLLIFCFSFLIFLTFSRSAWLVGITLLVLGYLNNLRSLGKKKRTLLILILLISILYTIYYILYTLTSTDPENFQKRWQLTLVSWQMIKSSPLIGVGLGHFIPKLAEFPQKGQVFWLQPVHNIFLLVAAETGIAGLLLFLSLIIKSLKNSLKIGNWKLEIPLLAILLTGAADHYWLTLQQNQLLFALILGLCWTNLKKV